ncbi:MAG: hypothetical protein COV96_01600 [Candidatus Zambryskibacteria bacterium CG11_big_fil_rev_8_21_14_0_20_42_18]|uniref:Uncharacterized protein n=1 Tax=Candidatus Zambryskibacteria bacterium CG_4_9_14_3_um_filter_42_15 TaxID=1975112 RepID=A0A2M7WRC5_9BACT|nr:MAG: hypothetical protein COV96_01600 [Candidatus Zambryskibacteria bacterium CG11_big_fil_rev_8_21_14_0_20_42_18]PJA32549.1 MAG: hypothetical protein CO185_02540 [Candidatus Zambryskibacteria bacterium CG_4_9_14_3_um_filter_42_15]
MKRLLIIFLSAFVLNIVWENLHSFLYSNYMGGEITEFILIRASLFDAFLITMILLPFLYLNALKNKSWLIIVIGIIIAVLNEWYGLNTNRWAYNSLMPILPIIKVGLTPTLQLGVSGYLSYKVGEYISTRYFFS